MKIIFTKKEKSPNPFEMCERKGLGHPDTMADTIAEDFSRNLCKYYLDNFGKILHHNVDKLDLVGGSSNPEFGGGKVIEPIIAFFSGRATQIFENKKVPLKDMAKDTLDNYINKNFRYLKPEHFEMIVKTKHGSGDLVHNYDENGVPLAGDTSMGVGFAPLTKLEQIVLETEQFLNGGLKKHYPFIGEDIKIMGVRDEDKFKVIIACPMISSETESKEEYMSNKEKLKETVNKFIEDRFGVVPEVLINCADMPEMNSFYLTVTGTSAESGDDGAVGRGNRVNGLITPFRPMVMEAASGKNPVNHVGKIYNIVANKLANSIYNELQIPVNVFILSKIGHPINDPEFVSVSTESKKDKVKEQIDYWLENIPGLTEEFVKGG
jgi:S-adenosylmethionine synthetase